MIDAYERGSGIASMVAGLRLAAMISAIVKSSG